MHWIQTIRENLALSREELGHYLQLSPHMIQSVELGRRQLPIDSLRTAIAMYNAVKDSLGHSPVPDPLPKAAHHLQRVEKLHHQCCRTLDRCASKLEEMQKAHASACLHLGVYQSLAGALTLTPDKSDFARLRWTEQKIEETMKRLKENNTTTQDLLTAEIAGLKSMRQVLEEARLKL